MFPAALAIVVAAFPVAERGKALAIFFGLTGALTAVGPLAGGYLTGRYRKGADVPADSRLGRRFGAQFEDERQRVDHERRLDAVEELLKVAADAGCSLTHLATAFVLEHPAVTSAIIGPRTMDQLDDLLAGVEVRLDTEVLDRIDEIVPPGTSISGADPWQPEALRRRNRRRPH
jgi:aryl-alcohol dehydrogenase-like predicted oxidoreductase